MMCACRGIVYFQVRTRENRMNALKSELLARHAAQIQQEVSVAANQTPIAHETDKNK